MAWIVFNDRGLDQRLTAIAQDVAATRASLSKLSTQSLLNQQQILKEIRSMADTLSTFSQTEHDETAALVDLNTAVQGALAKISDLLGKLGSATDPAEVEALNAEAQANLATIKQATAALAGAVQPPAGAPAASGASEQPPAAAPGDGVRAGRGA